MRCARGGGGGASRCARGGAAESRAGRRAPLPLRRPASAAGALAQPLARLAATRGARSRDHLATGGWRVRVRALLLTIASLVSVARARGDRKGRLSVPAVARQLVREVPELGARFGLPREDEGSHPVRVAAERALRLYHDEGWALQPALREALVELVESFRTHAPPPAGAVAREDVAGVLWARDKEGGWWARAAWSSRWQARVEPHTGAAWVRDERSGAWARAGFARLRNPGVEGVLDDAIKERTAQLADSAPRFRRGEEGRWYKKVWLPARPAAAATQAAAGDAGAAALQQTGLQPMFVPAFERDLWRRAPGGLLASLADRPFRAFLREQPSEPGAPAERSWLQVPDAVATGAVGGAGNRATRSFKIAEAAVIDRLFAREMALQLIEAERVVAALESAAAGGQQDGTALLAAVTGACGAGADAGAARWALERVAVLTGHDMALAAVHSADSTASFSVAEDPAAHAAEVLGAASKTLAATLGGMREAATHAAVAAATDLVERAAADAAGAGADEASLESLGAIAAASGDEAAAWGVLLEAAKEADASGEVAAAGDAQGARRAAARVLAPAADDQAAYKALISALASQGSADSVTAWAELIAVAGRAGGENALAAARETGGELSLRKAAAEVLLQAARRSRGLAELRAALTDSTGADASALGAALERVGVWSDRSVDAVHSAAKEAKLSEALRAAAAPVEGSALGLGDVALDALCAKLDSAAEGVGIEGSYTHGLFVDELKRSCVRVGGTVEVFCGNDRVGWPLLDPNPLATAADADADAGSTSTARALRECERLWAAGVRDASFLDLYDYLQQRHSLAPDATDLPPAERGTDEYERLVEQFVVPTWRAHSPGATAGVAGDWQHAPPADSESGDGRLIEPLKVVSLPRGMERRPRLRLEKVSGYGAAPRRGGPLATLGRPDPSEIHGQLLGPIVIEDDTGEGHSQEDAREDAADARLRAQRSNELFQSDAAPKRLLELTAAQHAAEIVEAGGLRRRLRAHRFRRWLDRTASGAAGSALVSEAL